ncbi:uncharacterized protein EDB91DRAFT_1056609, partial [Suillus paluster]|uniref:uncharacterized protein n=1 Tax=Suillus paluster TaxID=48578 RepID=UPI001B86B9C7
MVDPLVHLCTFFHTPTIKCTWFSCCWELLHCILGALLGKHIPYRHGIIHRDTIDSNVWMWIPQIDEWFAVPEWIKEQDGKMHFRMAVVDPEWFPRRPGVAGDFALVLDMLERTFPFGTSAENEAPGVTHDLEAYIYLIWLIGVNFKGPY